jgi:hypothetical protein
MGASRTSGTRPMPDMAVAGDYRSIARGDEGPTLPLTGAVLAAPRRAAQPALTVTAHPDCDTRVETRPQNMSVKSTAEPCLWQWSS